MLVVDRSIRTLNRLGHNSGGNCRWRFPWRPLRLRSWDIPEVKEGSVRILFTNAYLHTQIIQSSMKYSLERPTPRTSRTLVRSR